MGGSFPSSLNLVQIPPQPGRTERSCIISPGCNLEGSQLLAKKKAASTMFLERCQPQLTENPTRRHNQLGGPLALMVVVSSRERYDVKVWPMASLLDWPLFGHERRNQHLQYFKRLMEIGIKSVPITSQNVTTKVSQKG